jgi:hypothetical protein
LGEGANGAGGGEVGAVDEEECIGVAIKAVGGSGAESGPGVEKLN